MRTLAPWKLWLLLLGSGLVAHAEDPAGAPAVEPDLEFAETQQVQYSQSYSQPSYETSTAYSAPSYSGHSHSAPAHSSYSTPAYEAKAQAKSDYDTQSSTTYQKRDYQPASYSYATSYSQSSAYNSSYDQYGSYSPWRSQPGSYTKDSYGGSRYRGKSYNSQSIYSSYLNSAAYNSYSKQCSRSYGAAPKLTYKDLAAAFQYAIHELKGLDGYEKSQYKAGKYMKMSEYSSGARHQVATYLTQQKTNIHKKEKEALFMEYASRYLLKHNCLSKLDAHYLLPQVKIDPKSYGSSPYGDNSCYSTYGIKGASKLHCKDSKYRTADGSCNNLYHPYWGKAFVCHLRLVPPAYEDGVQAPRIHSVLGHPLPSARVVSTTCHADKPDRSYYTHMKMVFGQYINHDITFTPTSNANYEGGAIKCCPKAEHPACLPIEVPSNDYYQSKYKKTCMNFVRSAPCSLCNMGPRQQENIATSFLDNGAAYGNSNSDSHRLRLHKGGLLKTAKDKCGYDIMPPTSQAWDDQCTQYPGMPCFDSGDPRVNQHPQLQMIHTLWLRGHNYHARHLARVNPKWGDERLYHEARRISVAQLQHITYHEYLPILFGPTLMKYFSLETSYGSGYSNYEPYTDPTTWNDYATAACRFGHSQISSFFSLVGYPANYTNKYAYGRNGNQAGFWLRDWFFDPKLIYDCQIDPMVKGLLHDHSMVVDPFIASDIKNYLYRTKKEPVGSDLPAFNIQRSRDHGIPPYHVYLKFCFGYDAYSWDDLGKFIPYEQLYHLKKVYKDWRDVEFWPAGMSERKFPDADVGPTFACVLGIQYYHLKFGDRYFYSHGHQTGSFTPAQLASLQKHTSLSAFLCKHGDYIDAVQRYAFFPVSSYNHLVSCKNQPDIDYSLWKEAY